MVAHITYKRNTSSNPGDPYRVDPTPHLLARERAPHLTSVLVDPFVLDVLSVVIVETCMIGQCLDPCPLETYCHGVTVIPGQAVHYARVSCTGQTERRAVLVVLIRTQLDHLLALQGGDSYVDNAS